MEGRGGVSVLALEPSRGSPGAQTAAAHTVLCFPSSPRVPNHMPFTSHLQCQRQRLEGCAMGFTLLWDFLNPSRGWLGGQGADEQEVSQRAALGVMRRGELIHIQGCPRLISFSCSKSASLNGAVLVTEGYLFSCSPSCGFPSPLPFSLSHNYLCPILTMQLVKTVTEIFPGHPNSNCCTSALSCGRFAVLFGYQQSVMINRAEDKKR